LSSIIGVDVRVTFNSVKCSCLFTGSSFQLTNYMSISSNAPWISHDPPPSFHLAVGLVTASK